MRQGKAAPGLSGRRRDSEQKAPGARPQDHVEAASRDGDALVLVGAPVLSRGTAALVMESAQIRVSGAWRPTVNGAKRHLFEIDPGPEISIHARASARQESVRAGSRSLDGPRCDVPAMPGKRPVCGREHLGFYDTAVDVPSTDRFYWPGCVAIIRAGTSFRLGLKRRSRRMASWYVEKIDRGGSRSW